MVQLIESYWKTRRVQFLESYWKKSSILRVILEKSWILWVNLHKKNSILWVIFKSGFNFYESCWRERFNFVSHVEKKGWILWSFSKKKKFNSLSHVKKDSILWVIFLIKENVFNSLSRTRRRFNSLSGIGKKASIFESFKNVQFFESHSKIQFFGS